MRILIIGGTRFLGPRVAAMLVKAGHQVSLFHRGQVETVVSAAANHIHGDRRNLPTFKSQFKRLAPDVVIDMICHNERDASGLIQTFEGVAERLVVISSMDVYRAYGCLLRHETAFPETTPLNEDSPLRTSCFPYRTQANSPDDMAFDYDKIPVEQVVMNATRLTGTVLRLAAVYGPGDHRVFDHLKRMLDGRDRILLEKEHARWRWTRGYVDNVAAAIALASVDDRAGGRVYNVGEPEALTETEWVQTIGRAIGWEGKVVTLTRESMPKHLVAPYDFTHHLMGDTNRIRDELGYVEYVPREEAMRQTVEWERTHPPQEGTLRRFDYSAEDSALD